MKSARRRSVFQRVTFRHAEGHPLPCERSPFTWQSVTLREPFRNLLHVKT